MKRFFKIVTAALAIGVAATLAGCGGFASCSSCSSCNSNSKNTALTNSNWFTGTGYKGIQPSFIDGEKEIISYAVTYNGDSRLFLLTKVERLTVKMRLWVGRGIGPLMIAPVALTVLTIFSALLSTKLWS